MINFIKNLFKKKEDRFRVIHYPASGLYFPLVNRRFLYEDPDSGMVTYNDDFLGTLYAESFNSQIEAWKCIDKWREHHRNFKVEVFSRD